jgi:2-polyprenyl-3-methyl-5-hydroxy-6-metoxy-1,4-benzoquinol methylase
MTGERSVIKTNLYRKYLRLAGRISSYQEYSLTRPFLKGKILDIGCGLGGIAAFVRPEDYIGIDIVERYLAKARSTYPHHKFLFLDCMDNEKVFTILGEKKFDTILFLTLLEFVPEPKLIVNNCRGLLTDNGKVIITVASSLIGKLHGYIYKKSNIPIEAISYFSRSYIKELLKGSFTIECIKSYNLGLSYFVVARASNTVK